MTVIYHNRDLDGYCSAAVCQLAYPDARLIGYDYDQPLPPEMDEIDDMIMVDVSIPIIRMRFFAECCERKQKTFTWIDHHISAIKEYRQVEAEMGTYITAVLDESISACEGAWKYLFPDMVMPEVVTLLGKYDSWRESDTPYWDNSILPFQYGMRMICNSAETFPIRLFSPGSHNVISDIIEKGKAILSYQQLQNERTMKFAFETVFEGLRALCVNAGGGNSNLFTSRYDEAKHDLMIPFFYSGRGWTFSFYTTKEEVDCSVIAKKYGGGGHKKAAGMNVKELPTAFRLENIREETSSILN